MFDLLIIGGGASGISCAMVLGSAQNMPFVKDKKIGIIMHQKSSALQDAIFYNSYGVSNGKLGSEVLSETAEQLRTTYPEIHQLSAEKVTKIVKNSDGFDIITTSNNYQSKIVVVAIGSSNLFNIDGLLEFVVPHAKTSSDKNRIQLVNVDHLIYEGMYVAGTLAGHRSQLSIASGSGAAVATDILTLWNNGVHTHAHDVVKK